MNKLKLLSEYKRSVGHTYNVDLLDVLKSNKNEIVFSKREMNNEWNVNFLEDTTIDIQHTNPISDMV